MIVVVQTKLDNADIVVLSHHNSTIKQRVDDHTEYVNFFNTSPNLPQENKKQYSNIKDNYPTKD